MLFQIQFVLLLSARLLLLLPLGGFGYGAGPRPLGSLTAKASLHPLSLLLTSSQCLLKQQLRLLLLQKLQWQLLWLHCKLTCYQVFMHLRPHLLLLLAMTGLCISHRCRIAQQALSCGAQRLASSHERTAAVLQRAVSSCMLLHVRLLLVLLLLLLVGS